MDWHLKRKKAAHLNEWKRRKEQKEAAKQNPPKPKVLHTPVMMVKPWVLKPHPKGIFNSGHGFAEALEKKGYQRVGSGMYSTVYAKKDSSKVIKVNHREDQWIDYMLWAQKEGPQFAPKLYSYKLFNKATEPFTVSVLERMDLTIHRVKDKNSMALPISRLADYAANDNEPSAKVIDMLAPGLGTFLLKIGKEFKGNLDLHGGNMMVRKDGTIAITDPVVGKRKTTITRWKTAA